LIDDNGDGKGTRADWFEGWRVTRKSAEGAPADGVASARMALVPAPSDRALTKEQRVRRDRLEDEIEALRGLREKMGEKGWYEQLEARFLELGKLLGS
jgi:hypothetical protein